LATSGAPILAVEIDRDLVADLASRAPRNVTVVSGNFLKTDVLPYLAGLEPQRPAAASAATTARQTPPPATPFAEPAPAPRRRLRVVGNLPYNLSTPIL